MASGVRFAWASNNPWTVSRRQLGAGGVPLDQRLISLRVGQQRQLREPPVRIGDDALQKSPEMTEEASDRPRLEQVDVVLGGQLQPIGFVPEVQHQIKPGRASIDRHRFHLQSGEARHGRRGVLQGEHHLEECRMAETSLRLELLDQPLERQILMGVRVEGRLADSAKQLPEGGIPREIGSERQSIHEEADQTLGFRPGATRDG